jgi:hypothetical protein
MQGNAIRLATFAGSIALLAAAHAQLAAAEAPEEVSPVYEFPSVPAQPWRLGEVLGASVLDGAGESIGPARADCDAGAQVPLAREPVAPLYTDADLATIDPRLAEGIAANERAYGRKLDHDAYDNEDERAQRNADGQDAAAE